MKEVWRRRTALPQEERGRITTDLRRKRRTKDIKKPETARMCCAEEGTASGWPEFVKI
jgi:hypothetical protein